MKGSGSWCSLCGLLILVFAAAYLYLLGLFLHHLATNGEENVNNLFKLIEDTSFLNLLTACTKLSLFVGCQAFEGVVHNINM